MSRQQLVDQAVPHLHADKPGGTTGEPDRLNNPGLQRGEIKPQNLWLQKLVSVAVVGGTPSFTGEFVGEAHRVLGHTQTHPARSQHQKGAIRLCIFGEVTASRLTDQQVVLFPLRPIPHI